MEARRRAGRQAGRRGRGRGTTSTQKTEPPERGCCLGLCVCVCVCRRGVERERAACICSAERGVDAVLCVCGVARVPQILIGASSSRSTGCCMKISRAAVQRPRISASDRLTCRPGREPRTSSSLEMIASTSGGGSAPPETSALELDEAIGTARRVDVASLKGASWKAGSQAEPPNNARVSASPRSTHYFKPDAERRRRGVPGDAGRPELGRGLP